MKFFIKDFFSKCDQIHRKLWIWSHLLKKSLMKNFSFCAVNTHFHWLIFPNILCSDWYLNVGQYLSQSIGAMVKSMRFVALHMTNHYKNSRNLDGGAFFKALPPRLMWFVLLVLSNQEKNLNLFKHLRDWTANFVPNISLKT